MAANAGVQPLDLSEAARRAIHLLEPECRRHGVATLVHAPAPTMVKGDPVAVDQIVHNLLMNALQAMDGVEPAQRELTVTARNDGEHAELAIADRGPGIPAEAMPRLFEPFFSTREGGLGLGLSLCETLAQGMGGSLTADNRPDGGAVFRLRLPLRSQA